MPHLKAGSAYFILQERFGWRVFNPQGKEEKQLSWVFRKIRDQAKLVCVLLSSKPSLPELVLGIS